MMEERIYNYLVDYHVGKDKLIKNQDLRNMFGIQSDKALRKVIQNIRESKEFEEVIGSVSGKAGGFYVCECEEEIQETIDNIKHRANQMLRMTHILEWKKTLKEG